MVKDIYKEEKTGHFLMINLSVLGQKWAVLNQEKAVFKAESGLFAAVYCENNCTLYILCRYYAEQQGVTFAHDLGSICAQIFLISENARSGASTKISLKGKNCVYISERQKIIDGTIRNQQQAKTISKKYLILLSAPLIYCTFCNNFVFLQQEVTKKVYFIGNERMLIAHDSNRLRFS